MNMYSIKKVSYQKNGSKWERQSVKIEKFDNFIKAKSYYNNVVADSLGRTRCEYSPSEYGTIKSKSFYSPSGLEKVKYIF